MTFAIEAEHLHRTFHPSRGIFRRGEELVAVEDVSMQVPQGSIFGLLGHNGAGKTTTIKMLSTLLIPTRGSARVAGYDVTTEEREVRQRLGVVLGGDRGLYGKLSARDNLIYFGHLFGMDDDDIGPRADELLETVGLEDRADHRIEGFSRGMKQRLHLARALMHRPPVLFLDEPSIGLDPAAAIKLRQIITQLVPEHTILLTTHYLHEADELCDQIAIIDHGRIIVEDTPEGIKHRVGGERRHWIDVQGLINQTSELLLARLSGANAVEITPNGTTTRVTLVTASEDAAIDEAIRLLQHAGFRIQNVDSAELTLEDAFLALTDGGQHGNP